MFVPNFAAGVPAGPLPRSGVYSDTQSEENGWTALGLIASLLLLALLKRWMFYTATMLQAPLAVRPIVRVLEQLLRFARGCAARLLTAY